MAAGDNLAITVISSTENKTGRTDVQKKTKPKQNVQDAQKVQALVNQKQSVLQDVNPHQIFL